MLDRLRSVKMARRGAEPDPELIGELFRAAASKFTCPDCGAGGLVTRPVDEESDEAWGMARACESCGRPIARERLEIFPQAKRCAACQASDERGEDTAPAEFCPRCGNVMTLRPTRGPGLARYVMACTRCRG